VKNNGPILLAIPLPFYDGETFWVRDMGLIVLGIRSLGIDARLVAYGRRENHPPDLPLILGTSDDFRNPLWWQKLAPQGIVLNTWSASRYNDIRKAALSATPHILEKLDTDGVRSPRIWLWKYMRTSFNSCQDNGLLQRIFSPCRAISHTLAGYCLVDRKITAAMNLMPALAAESPLAAERMRRLMRLYHDPIPKIICIPHAVRDDYMLPDSGSTKENRIVSVGRWHSYFKNFPMLLTVLEKFLKIHPAWGADVIGELPKGWRPESRFSTETLRSRLRFHGFKAHKEISSISNKAKIFFMSSRSESFNIAAAEALCCGCSVVGATDIASAHFFAGESSGTVATRQHRDHFLDALGTEVDAWETGRRNPEQISKKWVATVGSVAVGKKVVECLESLRG